MSPVVKHLDVCCNTLHALLRLPIMLQQAVAFVSIVAFLMLGWWCEESIELVPLTHPPSTPIPISHLMKPDYGATSHPGRFWPFGSSNGSVPCRSCNRHTNQLGVRHFAWWSGDVTRTEWMQSASQCQECGTINMVQQDKVDGAEVGPLRLILPVLPEWQRWRSLDALSQVAHHPEVGPREGHTPCDDVPMCNLVSQGHFTHRRAIWRVGRMDLLWECETLRVVFNADTHQGMLVPSKQRECVAPLSWLCALAAWCYASLVAWWFVVVVVAIPVTFPYAARLLSKTKPAHVA